MWIKSANHLCMFSEESKIVRDKYDGWIDHQGWVTAQHSRLNHPQMGMCSCFGDMCSLLIWVRCLPYIGKHTGWWFGPFFIFPYTGNNNPIWLIFFRGVETTNHYNISKNTKLEITCRLSETHRGNDHVLTNKNKHWQIYWTLRSQQ
jgi:hypothetical protein